GARRLSAERRGDRRLEEEEGDERHEHRDADRDAAEARDRALVHVATARYGERAVPERDGPDHRGQQAARGACGRASEEKRVQRRTAFPRKWGDKSTSPPPDKGRKGALFASMRA